MLISTGPLSKLPVALRSVIYAYVPEAFSLTFGKTEEWVWSRVSMNSYFPLATPFYEIWHLDAHNILPQFHTQYPSLIIDVSNHSYLHLTYPNRISATYSFLSFFFQCIEQLNLKKKIEEVLVILKNHDHMLLRKLFKISSGKFNWCRQVGTRISWQAKWKGEGWYLERISGSMDLVLGK